MKHFGFIQQLLGNEQQNTGTFDKNLHIQLQTFAYTRLLNKPYKNEFTFREQNLPLKCHKPLKLFCTSGMDRRSLLRPKQKQKQKGKNLLPAAEGRSRSRRFKNQHFLPKNIEEHLFIMLLKLVISILPFF